MRLGDREHGSDDQQHDAQRDHGFTLDPPV
jgi:hypothetical protein